MNALFAWVPWFTELARKIADNDADYFVPRVRKIWSNAVGPDAALLTKSSADLDPFSFFYTLASKNARSTAATSPRSSASSTFCWSTGMRRSGSSTPTSPSPCRRTCTSSAP